MEWDFYLTVKVGGIALFIFTGGLAASKALGIPRVKAFLINSAAVFIGYCGSTTWYVVQNGASFGMAGAVLYGWVLGGTLALFLITKGMNLPTLRYFDAVLPWMLVAQFLNRLGCYNAGCCFGIPGHPVQLYEGFFDLALFALIKTRKPRVGLATFLYFTGYPIARFFFEFLRGDNKPALWFMTVPQVTSLIILIVVFRLKNKILL